MSISIKRVTVNIPFTFHRFTKRQHIPWVETLYVYRKKVIKKIWKPLKKEGLGDEVSKEICMLKKISVDYETPLTVMNTVIVLKKKKGWGIESWL